MIDKTNSIACWFIDADNNQERIFVRHASFLFANDPYSTLKTPARPKSTPKLGHSLNSDTYRPFEKPKRGRIAAKVIKHLGEELMKDFRVIKVISKTDG